MNEFDLECEIHSILELLMSRSYKFDPELETELRAMFQLLRAGDTVGMEGPPGRDQGEDKSQPDPVLDRWIRRSHERSRLLLRPQAPPRRGTTNQPTAHLGRRHDMKINVRKILPGDDLSGADLRGADLHGANLIGVNLNGANLEGANLRGTLLWYADLTGANMRGANIKHTDFKGAKLDPGALLDCEHCDR